MTKKENEDFAHYFMTYLQSAMQSENNDSGDIANMATDMVKDILINNPKIRHIIWLYGQEEYLNELNLDYGHE